MWLEEESTISLFRRAEMKGVEDRIVNSVCLIKTKAKTKRSRSVCS